jgi:hypothetical protein
MPGGIGGALGEASGPPTAQLSASTWAAHPLCDPLFGPVDDPTCQPSMPVGENDCSAAGIISPGPTLPPPAEWPQFRYVHSWDQNKLTTVVAYPIPGGWGATAYCNTYNTCQIPTVSVCQQPFHGYIPEVEIFDVEAVGAVSSITATTAAQEACFAGEYPSAWAVIGVYNPADPGGPGSCEPTTVSKSVAETPCQ